MLLLPLVFQGHDILFTRVYKASLYPFLSIWDGEELNVGMGKNDQNPIDKKPTNIRKTTPLFSAHHLLCVAWVGPQLLGWLEEAEACDGHLATQVGWFVQLPAYAEQNQHGYIIQNAAHVFPTPHYTHQVFPPRTPYSETESGRGFSVECSKYSTWDSVGLEHSEDCPPKK